MLTPRRVLRRRLVTYALALGYVVTLAVGATLMAQDPRLTRQGIVSAVGVNLVAAAVFGLIFSTLSARSQERALEENIEERLSELSNDITKALSLNNGLFLPLSSYPAVDDFNSVFNRDLSRSMEATSFYGFRGPSPRYLPARIRSAKRHPQQLRVCMLDPSQERAVARRAADRRSRPASRGKTLDQLVEDMRTELLMSVVALFDCRRICPIELSYGAEAGVFRAELFDDVVYVSWYHGLPSAGHTFPESLSFSKGSLMYETIKLDINRQFEISERRITFNSGDNDDDLCHHLESLVGESFDSNRIVALRADYDKFIGKFSEHLGLVTVA